MIRNIFKTVLVGTLAYYAARRASAQMKLMAIREEAKAEMDRLQTILKGNYVRDAGFDLTDAEKSAQFDDLIKQYNKWSKVYNKTF
jgi:hypothetical protein